MSFDMMRKLRRVGLLAECHTWAETQGQPREQTYAWCLVNSCPEYRRTGSRHRDTCRAAIDCPFCEHALLWRKKKHEVKLGEKIRPVPRSGESKNFRRK